jgi:SAM-dependent methyltransferase
LTAPVRHRRLREYFGEAGVARERTRYSRDATGPFRKELIERFLLRHVPRGSRSVLEIGPGPGRFSPLLAGRGRSVTFLDLSRPMLRATRRRLGRRRSRGRPSFVESSLEALPFRPGAFDLIVAMGVLLFVADDFPRVLRDLGRLLRPDGRLVFEMHVPSQDMMTLLPAAPEVARRILAEPGRHHLWKVVRRGYQPFDPARFAQFEVVWRRPSVLERDLRRAGLAVDDLLAVAPNFGNQPGLVRHLRRDRKAYATALRLEEELGRWPELLGAGSALLVSARRAAR